MSPLEVRASLSLASLFALRMLGLFLILPVFAVHAMHLAGGENRTLVGLALGVYGLTQGVLQLPFGIASDRFGRKKVIVFGLLVFAAGSFLAAAAVDIRWTIAGRALQGAGAISAAVMAMLADLTPAALDRVVDRRWDPPVTLGVRLVSIADDSLQHAGQAAYVRGLLGA